MIKYYDCNYCTAKNCAGDIIRTGWGTRKTLKRSSCPSWNPPAGTFPLRELLLFHPQSFMSLHNVGFRVEIP